MRHGEKLRNSVDNWLNLGAFKLGGGTETLGGVGDGPEKKKSPTRIRGKGQGPGFVRLKGSPRVIKKRTRGFAYKGTSNELRGKEAISLDAKNRTGNSL